MPRRPHFVQGPCIIHIYIYIDSSVHLNALSYYYYCYITAIRYGVFIFRRCGQTISRARVCINYKRCFVDVFYVRCALQTIGKSNVTAFRPVSARDVVRYMYYVYRHLHDSRPNGVRTSIRIFEINSLLRIVRHMECRTNTLLRYGSKGPGVKRSCGTVGLWRSMTIQEP